MTGWKPSITRLEFQLLAKVLCTDTTYCGEILLEDRIDPASSRLLKILVVAYPALILMSAFLIAKTLSARS
jgi:hypothetical protein